MCSREAAQECSPGRKLPWVGEWEMAEPWKGERKIVGLQDGQCCSRRSQNHPENCLVVRHTAPDREPVEGVRVAAILAPFKGYVIFVS